MIKRIISITAKGAMIGCLCLTLSVRPAQAFIWPVIDLTEIVSFVNSITTGLNQITNAKSQLDNINNTIKVIGDQVSSIRKYAADLKGTITNIKDNVTKITQNVTETAQNLDDIAADVDETINQGLNTEKENNSCNKKRSIDLFFVWQVHAKFVISEEMTVKVRRCIKREVFRRYGMPHKMKVFGFCRRIFAHCIF